MDDSSTVTKRVLKIVHVITALGPGGAERQVQLLASKSSHDVSVVCLYFRGIVGDQIEGAGGRVKVLGMKGIQKITALWRLRHIIRELSPDVVNVHLLSAQVFGTIAARLAGVRVVVSTEHSLMDGSLEELQTGRLFRTVYRILERMTFQTVAVSDTTRHRLMNLGVRDGRISVIENGLDFESLEFAPAIRQEVRDVIGVPGDEIVLGAVGRLVEQKKFDVLIQTVAPLLTSYDARLVILGDGPLRQYLELTATLHHVGNRVMLVGSVSNVAHYLNAFDLFVSCSQDETFGLAIIEALGNGLSTIYGECPALDEIGEIPGAVKVVPPDDEISNVEALGLSEAIESAMKVGGRNPVSDVLIQHYGADRMVAAYDDLYRDLKSREDIRSSLHGKRHRIHIQAGAR